MNINELIEKQIEEAANFLAHAKTMKNRDRDMDRAFSALMAMSGRLLEVVQNQQAQIDELKESAWIARGVLEAYEDVRRRNDSLMDTVRKLKGER